MAWKYECEKPGYFTSGVPGILAHVEGGKLITPLNKVQCCDLCKRYETDKEAQLAAELLFLSK